MSREPVTVAPAKPTAARDTSCQINTVGAHWVRSLAMTFARSAAKAIGASDCSAPNGRGGQWDAPATGQISWSQMRGRRVERPLDRGPDEQPPGPWALGPWVAGLPPPRSSSRSRSTAVVQVAAALFCLIVFLFISVLGHVPRPRVSFVSHLSCVDPCLLCFPWHVLCSSTAVSFHRMHASLVIIRCFSI